MKEKSKIVVTGTTLPVPAQHQGAARGGGIGGIVGAVIGAAVGGPVGAAVGAAVLGGAGAYFGARTDEAR